MIRQLKVIFSGDVIGVGFRYQASRFAKALKINGYVQNTLDGKVELVGEGEEKKLKKLIEQLKGHFKNNITDVKISWADPSDKFYDFLIRYD